MRSKKNKLLYYLQTIPHFFRYGILALFIIFISLFFPVNIQIEYKFEQGSLWIYDDLRAPFSFPIQKTESELNNERKNLEKDFLPYYRLDNSVKEKEKKKFIDNLNKYLSSENYNTRKNTTSIEFQLFAEIGVRLIDKIYSYHILELEDRHRKNNNSSVLRLLENQVEIGEFKEKDFLNLKDATRMIVDSIEQIKKITSQSNILLNLISECIQVPDIRFEEGITKKNKELTLRNISPVRDKVQAGEIIIRNGEIVDSSSYKKIVSFILKYEEEVNKNKSPLLIYFGYLMLTISLIVIFTLYIYVYEKPVFDNLRHFTFIFVLLAGFAYLTLSIHNLNFISLYFIPFCIVPIVIRNFFSSQLAMFVHIGLVLLVSLIINVNFDFIFVQLLTGMVAVMSKGKIRYMSDFFVTVLYIGSTYIIGYICTEFMSKGVFFPILSDDGKIIESGVEWSTMGWIGLNILLTLLSYPFIPLLERGFGLISEITLIELSDLNKPLLRELSLKAPGTLQHSIQVSNLAEAAALSIKADALMVKVAALYHDIGKISNPNYFIENQNQINPHIDIGYLDSAKIILGHVSEGVKMAKKYRLPSVLIDFIKTHHGTTRVEYFYRMYKNENPELKIDEVDFTYKGPKPRNREEVILMLADSVEAASKSLKDPTGIDIDNLIEHIFTFKISNGQLQESNISFSELDSVKVVFKKLLRSIYHVRVEYPIDKSEVKGEENS